MLQGGAHLGGHLLIGLVVQGSALGVPDDDVLAFQLSQESARDLPGEGTGILRRHILRAESERKLVGRHQRLHAAQIGERREHRDLDRREIVSGILEIPSQLLHESDGLKVVQVHLPVARDQRCTPRVDVHCHPRTSSPGRRLPSRNSRLAPPPVEI